MTRGMKGTIVALLVVTGLAVVCQIVNETALFRWCQEDGLVEWMTVVFYALAAGLFFFTGPGWKSFPRLVLGILFLLIAGEEASWGQRVFDFQTPDAISQVNVQQEFNLHNHRSLQGIVRAGGLLVLSLICFVIPWTNRFFEGCRRWYEKMQMPIFPATGAVVVVFAILLMAVPRLLFDSKVFNLDEIGEAYLAFAMLMFARQKRIS